MEKQEKIDTCSDWQRIAKGNRICQITQCQNEVQPMNEADIGVGVIYSSEPAICDHCQNSTDQSIQDEINVILIDWKGGELLF